jgi:hypothetical protein
MSQGENITMCERIFILRSDGVICDPQPHGVRVLEGSAKYNEWCRKLGQWLVMAFDGEGKYLSKLYCTM